LFASAKIAQGEHNVKENLFFLYIVEPQPIFAFQRKDSDLE